MDRKKYPKWVTCTPLAPRTRRGGEVPSPDDLHHTCFIGLENFSSVSRLLSHSNTRLVAEVAGFSKPTREYYTSRGMNLIDQTWREVQTPISMGAPSQLHRPAADCTCDLISLKGTVTTVFSDTNLSQEDFSVFQIS